MFLFFWVGVVISIIAKVRFINCVALILPDTTNNTDGFTCQSQKKEEKVKHLL